MSDGAYDCQANQALLESMPDSCTTSVGALSSSHEAQLRTLRKRHKAEQRKLLALIERETFRTLNFVSLRSRNAITCGKRAAVNAQSPPSSSDR